MGKKRTASIFSGILTIILTGFAGVPGSAFAETFTLKAPPPELIPAGEGSVTIAAEGCSQELDPGNPVLPFRLVRYLVPPDIDLSTLKVEAADVEESLLHGKFAVVPAPPDRAQTLKGEAEDWGAGKRVVSGRNAAVYGKDAYYPPQPFKVLPPAQSRIWRSVPIKFYPFQYNPVTRRIKRTDLLTLEVSYARLSLRRGQRLTDDPLSERFRPDVVNSEEAAEWYGGPVRRTARSEGEGGDEPDSGSGYVIITTNAIESSSDNLSSLVTLKEARGWEVTVVTEDDYGALTGQSPNGTAEKIRKWLLDNYASMSVEYVLLVGDPDPDDPSSGSDSVGDVPMKMCWPRRGSSSYDRSPTDYFYADLTGDWDYDSDGYFGEWSDDYGPAGGVDLDPEVYVGRIPVYNGDTSTLDDIIAKLIDYEADDGDRSWRESTLLPMSFSNTSYDGAPLAEQMMDDYLTTRGHACWTQYQQGSGACGLNSSYASDEELRGGTTVRSRWSAGTYGVVCWWAHGSATSASVGCSGCWDGTLFSSSYAPYLNDAAPSFTYQCSCNNGWPENDGNLQYEILVNGGIGTVGASRVSWYNTGVGYGEFDGSTTNSGIGYEYVDRLTQPMAAGDALYEAKNSMTPGSKTRLMNYYDFNLYGDPSLELSTVDHDRPDMDFDTDTDVDDLQICAGQWGASDLYCDLDESGTVGASDIGMILSAWAP